MQNIERDQSIPERSTRQPNLRWDVLLNDLSLFASLCMAQAIVVRTLRRRRQERAERLKYIKLAPPPARDEVPNDISVDTQGEGQC